MPARSRAARLRQKNVSIRTRLYARDTAGHWNPEKNSHSHRQLSRNNRSVSGASDTIKPVLQSVTLCAGDILKNNCKIPYIILQSFNSLSRHSNCAINKNLNRRSSGSLSHPYTFYHATFFRNTWRLIDFKPK